MNKNIKNIFKKISLMLAFVMLMSVVSFNTGIGSTKVYAAGSVPQGYTSKAKTSVLELYSNESGDIAVKDLRNGYVWKSVVDSDVYAGVDSLSKKFTNYVKSPVTLSYINMDSRDSSPVKAYSYLTAPNPEVTAINNGIAVKYTFDPTTVNISFVIEYTIEDDQLIVRIPADKISEQNLVQVITNPGTPNEKIKDYYYGIESIEVLPFFGAAGDEVNGYLFYPDGCGGLTLYDNVDKRPADVKLATWKMYSSTIVSIDYDTAGVATLPVFGIKNNDNAILATVVEGVEQSAITAYPSGAANLRLNRMNIDIIYRNRYDINMSNISVNGSKEKNVVNRAQEKIIGEDREIRFFMLEGDEANYSSMAVTYRNYLLENGMINDVIKDGEELPLSLKVFMGISESKMFYKSFVKMTSFEEVITMLSDLADAGITKVSAILRGWIKGGYYSNPTNWPPDNAVGGKKGLKQLNEYLKSNTNVDLYLENDFVYANKDIGGFSARNDVVYDGANLSITNEYGSEAWYLLNPTAAAKRNDKFLDQISDYTEINAAYEYLGERIYQDYNKKAPSSRKQTVETWQELIKSAEDYSKKSAVQGANMYVYDSADFIYDIPVETYGYFITDTEVPFLQMVLSGLIPYSSTIGNLSADLQEEKLRWIEYGAVPNFEVTYEDALKLKNISDYNQLYTSKWSSWKDTIIETYNELKVALKDVYSYQMVKHEVVSEDVVKVTYSNGAVVYINYTDSDVKVDGNTIGANNYLVVKR